MSFQKGFTLVEIVVVLTIVGMIVAGVLKGQSMIQNSRSHSIMKIQSETQAAINAFQDRFHALPGDYSSASSNINCGNTPCLNGNGNGRIESNASGSITREDILAWSHLAGAGFVSGTYVYDGTSPNNEYNTPTNPYGAYLGISYDNVYGNGTTAIRHNIKVGNLVPSEVLLEVDRKIDDGNPFSGNFQFSTFSGNGASPDATTCTVSGTWNASGETNCGAAWIM
jgi:prepilin-type N-terminal cleavage/methylation domain-containing protein